MNYPKIKSRRVLNLGVMDFETPDEVALEQDDVLRRLSRTQIDAAQYQGLENCTEDRCGRSRCTAVCRWRQRRDRRNAIPNLHELFDELPICEVVWTRGSWARPIGGLHDVRIDIVRQTNARLLNGCRSVGVRAVGLVKIAPALAPGVEPVWVCKVHEIVMGVEKAELERRLSYYSRRSSSAFPALENWIVDPVSNRGQLISDVLRQDLHEWDAMDVVRRGAARMKKSERSELYACLSWLKPGALQLRHGMDKNLNPTPFKLRKQYLTPPHRRRRAPPEQYGFDSYYWDNHEIPQAGFGRRARAARQPPENPTDYYADLDPNFVPKKEVELDDLD